MADEISPEELRRLACSGVEQEIARLNALLASLQAPRTRIGRPPGPQARKRKGMSPAARKAAAERMKKYWAERRKSEK
jgi:hypothetical protein